LGKISLKTQNVHFVIEFLIYNIILLVTILGSSESFYSEFERNFTSINQNTVITFFGTLLCFVLSNILTPNSKATLVYWRINNPLPGSYAFTKLVFTDSRINADTLKSKLGKFPNEPKEQNSVWYKLYKEFSTVITVESSHKKFLLGRELTSMSFLIMCVFTIIVLYFKTVSITTLLYFMYLFFQYIVMMIVTRNLGNRFVCNVLAEYSVN
jgi:hypothetical protein